MVSLSRDVGNFSQIASIEMATIYAATNYVATVYIATIQLVEARMRLRGIRKLATLTITLPALCVSGLTVAQSTDKRPASATTVTASPKADEAAILNRALRQPMLAERMTKLFLMINLMALETRSRGQLSERVAEFETA